MKGGEQRRDEIRLNGVRLAVHIGVPDEERRVPQTVEADVVLVPKMPIGAESDDLSGTIDYEAVWRRLRELAAERPRKLVETLASEMATALLREYPLREVGVEIRKCILPGTRSVGVRVWRASDPP